MIFLTIIQHFPSHSPIISESILSEGSSSLLCPACIPGERIKSREKNIYICINQGHTGLVATAKARILLFYFISDSVNILFCRHQHHHLQFISPASIMYIMKYGATPVSSNEAGMREEYRLPRALFATGKRVDKCFLFQGSPFTT